MKEFKKWFTSGGLESIPDGEDTQLGREYEIYERQYDAWRAALEWTLSLKEPDHTDIFYVINPTLIKKELNDGSS